MYRRTPHNARQNAFSLIELAVVLVFAGALAAVFLATSRDVAGVECKETTQQQLRTIQEAVDRHLVRNELYPLPARLSRTQGSEGFGVAVLPGDPDFATTALKRIEVGGDASKIVYLGALPAVTLGLAPEQAQDCWGNKFTYAVSAGLTTPPDYPTAPGLLAIRRPDASGSYLDVMTNAAYAVISHGADGLGATPANSTTVRKACPNFVPPRSHQQRNCDGDSEFIDAPFNDGKDAADALSDDLILYQLKRASTTIATGSCPLPWDARLRIANGVSVPAYKVPGSANCGVESTSLTCIDGGLVGDTINYPHPYCADPGKCYDSCGGERNEGETWIATWRMPNAMQECRPGGEVFNIHNVPGDTVTDCP